MIRNFYIPLILKILGHNKASRIKVEISRDWTLMGTWINFIEGELDGKGFACLEV